MKKTKIVCSIGPASRTHDTMKRMIESGMNVARINFSHADETEKREARELVQTLNKELQTNVAILYDTKGPDFRTGNLETETIELVENAIIRLVKDDVLGTPEHITVNYKDVLSELAVDNIILLEDGLMKLIVISKEEDGVTCKILAGGILGPRKGINVPGVSLNMPFISEQDKEDIVYACKHDGDFLALSFVSCKEDIITVRNMLEEQGSKMQIISKVESGTAIKNLDEIVAYSDGVMVARGDLGVEVPMSELPILQKLMIQKCREQGKFCIVATEMLTSMQKSSRPTRAEVSDIANAVFDGTDAVMLSGETTMGKYPVEAVRFMADICENAEKHYVRDSHKFCYLLKEDITSTIAHSVVEAAAVLDVKAIIAATMSGYTAKKVSNLKPDCMVLAACADEKVARSLAISSGVYPMIVPICDTIEEVVNRAKKNVQKYIELKENDIIVITGSFPRNMQVKQTNFMKIEQI